MSNAWLGFALAAGYVFTGCGHGVIDDYDGSTDAGGDADADADADADVDADGDLDADGDADRDGDGDAPVPADLHPCEAGSCWETAADPVVCSYARVSQDFSTELYNVHDYASSLHDEAPTRITLDRTGGSWQPAIVVITDGGVVVSDGAIGVDRPGLRATVAREGWTGAQARVQITSGRDRSISIFVTSWEAIDSGFVAPMPRDATYTLLVESLCDAPPGLIAPPDTMGGETVADAGVHAMTIGSGATWGPPLRVDALRSEHIGFALSYSPGSADVEMELLAWDGAEPTSLAVTNAPAGLRFLAGFDPFGARTFWVRARGGASPGELTVTRTPIEDGPECLVSCDLLLQLPIPIDPARQGFARRGHDLVYSEQFGRKELLMAIFHAGHRIVESGIADPFTLGDLSRWDGEVWSEHETHEGGFHADLSLYDASGEAVWAILCDPDPAYSERQCIPGTVSNFGAEPMALLIAALFESGLFEGRAEAGIIMDQAYHAAVEAGADDLLAAGDITPDIRAMFEPATGLVYHAQPHHHHIHVRVDFE